MPEYSYQCVCGNKFERIFSMADMKPKVRCPECRKMAPRAIVAPNAIVRQRYGSPRTGRGMGKR
jgi:putative FmdB family regulatory protein